MKEWNKPEISELGLEQTFTDSTQYHICKADGSLDDNVPHTTPYQCQSGHKNLLHDSSGLLLYCCNES